MPPRPAGVPLDPEQERRYRERTPRSLERLEQTRRLIPTGHGGGMWYQLPYPVLLERGKGCRVWDVDGNEYLDLRIGDWVMILGHANDRHPRRDRGAAREGHAVRLRRLGSQLPDGITARRADAVARASPLPRRRGRRPTCSPCGSRARSPAAPRSRRRRAATTATPTLVVGSSTVGIAPDRVPAGVFPGIARELVEIPFNDPDGAEEILERERESIAAVLIEPVQGAAGMIAADRRSTSSGCAMSPSASASS